MDKKRESGQSMVELLVAAALVLIPMALLTTLLGKYISLQQNTLEAARNAAFARTAWSQSNDRGNAPGVQTNQQSNASIDAKTVIRFFGTQNTDLSSTATGSAQYTPRVLWTRNDGKALLPQYSDIQVHLLQGSPGDPVDQALETALQGVGLISDGGATRLDFQGLFTATATADPVPGSFLHPFNQMNLQFSSSDTLLADSWSAQGPKEVLAQTQNTLPLGEPALRTFIQTERPLVSDLDDLHLEKVLSDNPGELPADRLGGAP